MRAKEFLSEDDFNQWQKDALPGLKSLGDDSFYELYRLGITMASVGQDKGEAQVDVNGPADESALTISYSDEDEKIINTALKKHGVSSKNITPLGSREPKDTYKISPVANLGPVKRKNT